MGGEPGITKAVLTKIQVGVTVLAVNSMYHHIHSFLHKVCAFLQVCERPIIHLLDTPGVLPPRIQSLETGMKLALCGESRTHMVLQWHLLFWSLITDQYVPGLLWNMHIIHTRTSLVFISWYSSMQGITTHRSYCAIILLLGTFYLSISGTILDHLVGEDVIADYLLFSLNRLEKFGYKSFFLSP